MYLRLTLVILASLVASMVGLAQQHSPYAVPRTGHGHPDLQAVWAINFLTRLERPSDVSGLVANPEQAQAVAALLRSQSPDVLDPQVDWDDIGELAMVKGEYRTSVIVRPDDGRLPYTPFGLDLVARIRARNRRLFDSAEQRPLTERCMENFAYPPMRAIFVFLPHQILQTRDYVVIASEGAVPVRMIHLGGGSPPDAVRSIEGHSIGHWDGDTLVAQTTHLRVDDPAREVIGVRDGTVLPVHR